MSLETITDLKRWQQVVDELPQFPGKVYYSACYHKICEINGDGQPTALYFNEGQTRIFYPFLIRPVPAMLGGSGYFDMQTAYGYAGPLIFGGSPETISRFAGMQALWAVDNGIIAEFVRFNPFFDITMFSSFFKPELNRKTVSVELNPDFAVMLRQSSGPRQRNYRKALRAGLSYVSLTDCSEVATIYRKAMQRIGADDYYYFCDRYFSELQKMPTDSRFFAGIRDSKGELIAGGIFLQDSVAAHYHLGASAVEARELQPDAFMLFEAARQSAGSGRKLLHLGGGLSLADDDGLYRFKSGFSQHKHEFYIARKTHRHEVYNEISLKWQNLTGRQPHILLHYHEGLKHADV